MGSSGPRSLLGSEREPKNSSADAIDDHGGFHDVASLVLRIHTDTGERRQLRDLRIEG